MYINIDAIISSPSGLKGYLSHMVTVRERYTTLVNRESIIRRNFYKLILQIYSSNLLDHLESNNKDFLIFLLKIDKWLLEASFIKQPFEELILQIYNQRGVASFP